MALPAQARRRLELTNGGAVDVSDLGNALIIVPAGHGGLRALVQASIDDAGGYARLAQAVGEQDPELA